MKSRTQVLAAVCGGIAVYGLGSAVLMHTGFGTPEQLPPPSSYSSFSSSHSVPLGQERRQHLTFLSAEIPAQQIVLPMKEEHTLPDPEWPGFPKDPSWILKKSYPAKPAVLHQQPASLTESWRGKGVTPTTADPRYPHSNASDLAPYFPVGLFYFYDDIANHSVYLLQKTLEIVEPSVRQVSMYVAPRYKTFGWSYPVKMSFVMNAIKANWGKVIVVLDTDMVFYRPWVLSAAEVMRHNDIAFQGVDTYDPKLPKELTKMRKSITIAIVVIKCNERSLNLFKVVNDRITCNGRWIKNKVDQDELLNAVTTAQSHGLKWTVLPREFWGPAMSRSRCQMPPQPVMCHPDKKKGNQGGEWMPWHRKTEWKFHHIISQHCMGKFLISEKERGGWWHPYSLTSNIFSLSTPLPHPIDPRADFFVYSAFLPDDWCRFSFQVSLRATEPLLKTQFVNGSFSMAHAARVLELRPTGSITFFGTSATLFFKPFLRDVERMLSEAPAVPGSGLAVVHAGPGFVAVKKLKEEASPPPPFKTLLQKGVGLPEGAFHTLSSGNATLLSSVCIADDITRRTWNFPHWHTPRGIVGYLTMDEQYFYLLAYTQCGRPYTDPYHTMEFWTDPGEPVDTCRGKR